MRKLRYILTLVAGILMLTSCYRRDLDDADCKVRVVFRFDYDIVNYKVPGDPEMMRVVFYDHETGRRMTEAFLPPTGGEVTVLAGRHYDIVAWNFDTEVTQIKHEDEMEKVLATTGSIPESSKTKLKSRAKARTKDEAQSKGYASTRSGGADDELFLYNPDHLFVGRRMDMYITPPSVEGAETLIELDCRTVVESWILNVDKIKGAKYVSTISCVISNLSEFNNIAYDKRSVATATVYFDKGTLNHEGYYSVPFNTFGRNHELGLQQTLSLVITDLGGKNFVYNVDVTDQFIDNPLQIINIKTEDIDIPIPLTTTGGGMTPSVDEWTDIVSNIDI